MSTAMKKFISAQKLVGLALMSLGLTVISGWLLHNAAMVQIRAGFTGMVFNTALCFSLLGFTLLIADSQHRWRLRIMAAMAWAVIVLSTVVLADRKSVV